MKKEYLKNLYLISESIPPFIDTTQYTDKKVFELLVRMILECRYLIKDFILNDNELNKICEQCDISLEKMCVQDLELSEDALNYFNEMLEVFERESVRDEEYETAENFRRFGEKWKQEV